MSTIEKDFDRLALLDSGGWTANNHYHEFLLRHVPKHCEHALEIGCGTGAFARLLAERASRVTAIDLSPAMIGVAQLKYADDSNIEFRLNDINTTELPAEHFDCIAAIATLHHVSHSEVIQKMKSALKPSGVLLILDLLESQRSLLRLAGWRDNVASVFAMGIVFALRLIHNGRLRPPREVRAAWEEHGRHDSYLTIDEVRGLCGNLLPGARVRKHLLWRYSVVWQKPREI